MREKHLSGAKGLPFSKGIAGVLKDAGIRSPDGSPWSTNVWHNASWCAAWRLAEPFRIWDDRSQRPMYPPLDRSESLERMNWQVEVGAAGVSAFDRKRDERCGAS